MTETRFDAATVRDIIQAIPVGIVAIHPSGRVEVWNAAAEKILGWTSDDVVGGSLPIELPTNGEPEIEIHQRRKDGTFADLQIRVIPWRDSDGNDRGFLLFLTDVSAFRAAEKAVQELTAQGEKARSRVREHMRFRELLEAAPDAIIEVDQDGKIVLMNKAAEQLFGYSREELLGSPVEVLIPQKARASHEEHRRQYWKQPATRPMGTGLQLEGQRKDGSKVPVEISLSPVQFEEGFRVSAIIRDVSERRLAEEQLRAVQANYTEQLSAKNRELEARNQEVERANHLKSEFLSGMSHELRTPLHTIIGFTELLEEELEGPLNEKQHRFIRHIYKDSQHLLALINDVLDLSKIESGRLELQREVFPLQEALEETISSIQPRADAKSIHIATIVPELFEIFADRLRIKQILYNLTSNAVKFTPDGGSVGIEVVMRDDFVEISVSDTGIGIAPAEHQAVFDKFYQVGQRQAGGMEGTGLGLAITKHLVEQHGGSIRVESAPGKGARFTFCIPLAQAGAGATESAGF